MTANVLDDEAHRALARSTLESACAAFDIEAAAVEFGPRREEQNSFLCYLADPAVDGLIGPLTAKSAVDHFKRYDPYGIRQDSGKRIAIDVHELDTSSEATFQMFGDDGEDVLIPVWQRNLLLVCATFTYRVI
jgi:hypothetical protein